MGYSITQEQHEKSLRLKAQGRQCAMSTRGGGCFSRANVRITQESFPYKLDEGKVRIHEMVFCGRHGRQLVAEGGGVNFRITDSERF